MNSHISMKLELDWQSHRGLPAIMMRLRRSGTELMTYDIAISHGSAITEDGRNHGWMEPRTSRSYVKHARHQQGERHSNTHKIVMNPDEEHA